MFSYDSAKKVLPTQRQQLNQGKQKEGSFFRLHYFSYLLAGVSGAVTAGAAAVLTLRMRISASLVGVARGVAVTRAAATLWVDIGRR